MESGPPVTAVPHLWQACPSSVREHSDLGAIVDYVADARVRDRLREGQRDGHYPQAVLGELQTRGLAGLFGEHATAWHLSALQAELAAADGTLAITVGVNGLALLPIHLDADDALRKRVFERVAEGEMGAMLLTEWAHGSDLLANETRAVRSSDGYQVDGTKALINGGSRHNLLTVLARTRDRTLRTPQDRRAALGDHTLLWMERSDAVVATARHPTLPTRGADISQVEFRRAVVPRQAVVGREGDGFAVVRRTLTISRGGIAALAAGATAAVHAQARAYAESRVVYGAPIAQLDAIADHLAELAELDAECSAIAARAAAYANAFGVDAAPHTAAAKLVAPRIAERATELARRVLGSRALLEDHDLARFIRDVPLYGIFDGTQHVMLEELSFGLDRLCRGRRLDEANPLDRAHEAWTTPPRALQELGRLPNRLRPIDPRRVARALAARVDWPWLARLPALADRLFELRGQLGESGAWSRQSVRFGSAEGLAWLEACFASIELGNPGGIVGSPAEHPSDARVFEAAAAQRALRLVRRLEDLGASVPSPDAQLNEARTALLERCEALRHAVTEAVRGDGRG